jgi:hypothetical protein
MQNKKQNQTPSRAQAKPKPQPKPNPNRAKTSVTGGCSYASFREFVSCCPPVTLVLARFGFGLGWGLGLAWARLGVWFCFLFCMFSLFCFLSFFYTIILQIKKKICLFLQLFSSKISYKI